MDASDNDLYALLDVAADAWVLHRRPYRKYADPRCVAQLVTAATQSLQAEELEGPSRQGQLNAFIEIVAQKLTALTSMVSRLTYLSPARTRIIQKQVSCVHSG